MIKIDYKVKALLGIISVYFLIKDTLINKTSEQEPKYSLIFILSGILLFLIILNFIINKLEKKPIEKDYKAEIDAILKTEINYSEKIYLIDTLLNEKTSFGENMHLLNAKEKDLVFIMNFEREINNGGFHQFYFNSAGNYSIETLKALKAIGSLELFDILNKANSMFTNNFIPSDREKRQTILFSIEKSSEKTWEKCEEKYHLSKEDYIHLLYKYFIF